MELALQLKKRTEEYYLRLKANNAFYRSVFDGNVQHDTIAYFLESVRHLVAHTPIHLILAIRESEKKGLKDLAVFFRQKLKEETGHDQWAEADLKNLAALNPLQRKNLTVAPTVRETLKKNEENIKKDPYLYLVHIFFAEYFTVCDGPDFMAALDKIGIKPTMVSVVNNHVELDVGHVAEWEEIIGSLVDEKQYGKAFHESLKDSFAMYERFCSDLDQFNSQVFRKDRPA